MSIIKSLLTAGATLTLVSSLSAQAFTERFYVDNSNATPGNGSAWATSFKFLQDGIEQARTYLLSNAGPVEIWVADGFYYPDEDIGNPNGSMDPTRSFYMYDDITMYGGFEGNETVLSQRNLFDQSNESVLYGWLQPDVDPTVFSYHVVDGSFAGGNTGSGTHRAHLNGFMIGFGRAQGAGDWSKGGGFFSNFGKQYISNCRFWRNQALANGGNVCVEGSNTFVQLNNCTIEEGHASLGGGAYAGSGARLDITQGIIQNNGGMSQVGPVGGGGLHLDGDDTISFTVHSTFYNNMDTIGADFAVTNSAGFLAVNSIFRGSQSANGLSDIGFVSGLVSFDSCAVEGGLSQVQLWQSGTAATSNAFITDDPLFLDAPNGDFGLQLMSPCVGSARSWGMSDIGDIDQDGILNEWLPLDLSLSPRLVGADWDMGAFEAACAISTYCVSAPNSVSLDGAAIGASGTCSSSAQDLTFFATSTPNNPGLFFFAPNQTQLTFGNGFLCATGGIKRLPVVISVGNTATYLLDWSHPNIVSSFQPGDIRNVQFWYRDTAGGGAGFNTSNAMTLTVMP